ncbi:hypothetical protein CDD81_8053 [Ophiocordyceps australis]|uniref:aldehyde dehydrogenase (NAD(+)) n=1 Tax=Ophiocordyceps australis TaxID=1399860 RepID=A0A2C5XGF9_9HYPO|nr:hypothetical protein CDD81_8053 [Ophiocordyceps australis]
MAQTVELKAPNGVEICLPTGLFIANEFVKSQEGKTITSVSPINGKEICKVEAASAADIDRAVGAARAAFENASWRQMPGSERSGLLLRLASLIEAKTHTLATLETWDNGKPFSVSRDLDLPEAISCLRYYAGWADKLQGQTIPAQDPSKKLAYTLRQPVGVCAQIIPWNYPLAMAAWKLGPALAAGCTIVLKPAEQTPLSVLLLADLVRQAGFPAGVFNVVNGLGREAGAALAAHTGVDKIAFTGSTATGRQVMKMAAVNLKNMTLETGGKSPLLVFADAHIEQAARWACIGVMSNQGQVCSSTARILVEQSIIKDFTRAFVAAVQDMVKMGDPFSEQTTHGPQVSQQQHDAIMKHIAGATAQGAKLELGGASAQKTSGTNGFFVEPTVLSGVSGDMAVFADEIFGPVATLTPFGSEAEALTLANASEYGLAAAVFSASVERVHRVAARLEAGMVWVNSTNDSEVQIPFGGVKQSGVGRELGEAGLWAYTEIKAVHVNLGHIV